MAKTPTPKSTVDADAIRELALLLNETALTEIEYEREGVRIRVGRTPPPVVAQAAPAATAPAPVAIAPASVEPSAAKGGTGADPADHPGMVPSPMVGIVYLRPEPNQPPFAAVGDQVTEGQTLMLIEAMKTFNPVPAPRAGTVKAVLVSDTAPVEFAEPLIVIE